MANVTNTTTWPPDALCWTILTSDFPNHSLAEATATCAEVGIGNVTVGMINFLNLTKFDNYFQAYCNNPDPFDSCPFNVCPNSDVAGILTRFSIYLSSLLLAVLIYYSGDMDQVRDAYWAQNFTVYSVLVAAASGMYQHSISKLHTIIAMEFVGSPLTFYMAVYAIRSINGNKHRMSELFDGRRFWYRITALMTFVVWVVFLGFILGFPARHYAQSSCQDRMIGVDGLYLLPLVTMGYLIYKFPPGFLFFASPVLIVIVAWGVAIYRQRKVLWYKHGVRRRPKFFQVWTLVGSEYPFTHFMSVCFIPFVLWISTIEISLLSSNDNSLETSFGQVLALFVALPPLVSVLKLLPRFGRWFADLAWVRLITFRPQRVRTEPYGEAAALPLEHTGAYPPSIRRTGTDASDSTKWGHEDPYAGHGDYYKSPGLSTHRYTTVDTKGDL